MSTTKRITKQFLSTLSFNPMKMIIALLWLVMIQTSHAGQEIKTLVEEFPLKRGMDSEVTLPNFKGQIWSDGSASVSGKGAYDAEAPTRAYEYKVDIKQRTYTVRELDSTVIQLEPAVEPQEKIERKNLDPDVLALRGKSQRPDGISAQISTGYYTARVQVRTYDPIFIKLTETSNTLDWYTYSNGTVDWVSYSLSWWAANPSPLDTHWYISSTSHDGPYPLAANTQVYHNMSGSYYNYDFVFDDLGTFVTQTAGITGNNNATFYYNWSHNDSGEGSLLITGWVILN